MSFDALHSSTASDIAVEDWGLLFDAIRVRLIQTIETLPDSQTCGSVRSAQSTLLECIEALDHLHDATLEELNRRQAALDAAMQGAARTDGPAQASG